MSVFWTMVLLACTVVGTITIIYYGRPFHKLLTESQGLRIKDVQKGLMADLSEVDEEKLISSALALIVLYFVYFFIITPTATIAALMYDIGSQPLAMITAAIIAYHWFNVIPALLNQSQAVEEETELDENQVVPQKNLFVIYIKIIATLFPVFYLWYLFLVVLGILS